MCMFFPYSGLFIVIIKLNANCWFTYRGIFSTNVLQRYKSYFFSALLTTSTSETDIGNALLQLPVFHSSESLTVTAAPKANGAGIVLTITFSSKRGKLII